MTRPLYQRIPQPALWLMGGLYLAPFSARLLWSLKRSLGVPSGEYAPWTPDWMVERSNIIFRSSPKTAMEGVMAWEARHPYLTRLGYSPRNIIQDRIRRFTQ